MKLKKLRFCRAGALIAVGVFLGRGAQADTTITFDCTAVANHAILADCVPPQQNNPNGGPGITNYANFVTASSPGIAVSGFGTPNIGLTWGSDDFPTTSWEYYNTSGGLWGDGVGGSGVVQLANSHVGSTEQLTFTPNNPSAGVVVKSFDFFAYYNSNERFTYNVRVVSGTNVLSSQTVSFLSDGTKNHPVNLNYTGTPGQTLKLQLSRVASTLGAGETEGNQYNNAVDDIAFAQTPTTTFPAGPQVVSVTPRDENTGLPYAASITNGPTLTVAAPIQLKLDGIPVSPPPTISSSGGLTNVTYPGAAGLLIGSTHVYTLTYADNLGGIYTNEVVFKVNYQTLPPSYASPPGSGSHPGFTYRTVAVNQDTTDSIDCTLARAKAQLAGTLIDTSTGMPFTNAATLGPNADGSYNVTTVLNFSDNGPGAGNFPDDVEFPGLDAPPYNWFSTEAILNLDLAAGYYRLGVNSDDGFELSAIPPQGVSGSPIVLGEFDNGRGASDTLFDFVVQSSGVYSFRLIYFQCTQGASCELFSVTNLTTGAQVLINDPSVANSIKSFLVIPPRITNIVKSGSNVNIQWAYGNPPFQVQFKNDLNAALWSNSGGPTSTRSASVPISGGAGFIRIVGSP
jgi:hypothetical protein